MLNGRAVAAKFVSKDVMSSQKVNFKEKTSLIVFTARRNSKSCKCGGEAHSAE